MPLYTLATLTFITEVLHLVTRVLKNHPFSETNSLYGIIIVLLGWFLPQHPLLLTPH